MTHYYRAAKRICLGASWTRAYSAPADRSIPIAKQKYVPSSGTYPKGFLVGSSHAGVKESNKQYDDVALVASERPCAAAAVFTLNVFRAAPVLVSKAILSSRKPENQIRGVIVNSGSANAVTGQKGLADARSMAKAVDQCFDDPPDAEQPGTLVMSTGVIGKQLPIDRITNAIPKAHAALGSTHDHWLAVAKAICTTDTFPKLISRTFTLPSHPGTTYSIAGMTKGAGMIHPNMGTLLGVVCTDVKVEGTYLQDLLHSTVERSFNSISIDGDTSTNDTVVIFANGAAAPPNTAPLAKMSNNNEDTTAFEKVVEKFMADLAQLVVRDGEGATKFVTVRVQGRNTDVAKRVADSIVKSPLVKTALYGKDANWGRILCAIGYAPGVMERKHLPAITSSPSEKHGINPDSTSVSFVPTDGSAELKVLVRGEPQDFDEARAKQILDLEDLEILVKLDDSGLEQQDAMPEVKSWTCDFSHEYVTINGDYRT